MNQHLDHDNSSDAHAGFRASVLDYETPARKSGSARTICATALLVVLLIVASNILSLFVLGTTRRSTGRPGISTTPFAGGILVPLTLIMLVITAVVLRRWPAYRPHAKGIWIGLAAALLLHGFCMINLIAG